MRVSTKGRYALRMMIDMASCDTEGFISLRDVAVRQQISTKYMEQIASMLMKPGFLYSVRGPQGGYKLARPAAEYTVGEILRVTEGSMAPVSCLMREENPCERSPHCTTLPFWQGLHQLLEGYIDSVTLADLVQQQRQRAGVAAEGVIAISQIAE